MGAGVEGPAVVGGAAVVGPAVVGGAAVVGGEGVEFSMLALIKSKKAVTRP